MNDTSPAILSVCFAGIPLEHAIAKAREEKIEDASIEKIIAEAASTKHLVDADVAPSLVLSAWADDLVNAISTQADANTWRMVGHGAVVVHDDVNRACDMLRRVAVEANMRFVRIDSDEVMGIPIGAGDSFAKAAPILVYLEPGDWMRKIGEDTDWRTTGSRCNPGHRRRCGAGGEVDEVGGLDVMHLTLGEETKAGQVFEL